MEINHDLRTYTVYTDDGVQLYGRMSAYSIIQYLMYLMHFTLWVSECTYRVARL